MAGCRTAHVAAAAAAVLAAQVVVAEDTHPKCFLPSEFINGSKRAAADVRGLNRTASNIFYSVESYLNPSEEYIFNICGALPFEMGHSNNNGRPGVIRRPKENPVFNSGIVMGYWVRPYGNYTTATYTWMNHGQTQNPSKIGTMFTLYGDRDGSSTANQAKFTIYLECAQTERVSLDRHRERSDEAYVTVESPQACGLQNSQDPHADELDGVEFWALVVIPPVVILYCVIGFIYNHVKGARGLDRIPNNSIWFSLPLLVRDGCIFSREVATAKYNAIRGGGWKSDGTYQLLGHKETSGELSNVV